MNVQRTTTGPGNATVGVKWRFVGQEGDPIAWSVYPQLDFNTPSSVTKGIDVEGHRFAEYSGECTMTDRSDERDDGFGSELRKRQSPELARQERRRSLWAGVVGLGMGFTILAVGVDSVRTGKWVMFGSVGDAWDLPGWAVILIALFLLCGSGSILWRFARKI